MLKNRYAAAFICGVFLTSALPPVGFFPAVFVSIPVHMWLIARAGCARQAFLTGWAFGAGYFIFGLYWLAIAFSETYGLKPWFLPFVVFAIPGYIGLYYAVACAGAYYFRHKPVFYSVAYAVCLFWAEYARGHYPGDFPWNLIGSAWYHVLPVLQVVSLVGIYGLTLLTLLWVAGLYLALDAPRAKGAVPAAIFLFVTFVGCLGWGGARLLGEETAFFDARIVLLQPNITAEDRRQADANGQEDALVERHIELMRQMRQSDTTSLFVWPETVFSVPSRRSEGHFRRIAEATPKGSYTAVGVRRFQPRSGTREMYNSIAVLDAGGKKSFVYDKTELVPWGEYVPMLPLLKFAGLFEYFGGIPALSAGTGAKTLKIGALPSFSPGICFESAFSGRITDRKQRPDFLLFISNDAWASGSVGPLQNFSFTRIRAIEEGVPAVRAANIGVSAIFDSYGRELARLDMHQIGFLQGAVPKPIPPTAFSRYGEGPFFLIALLFSAIILAGAFIRSTKA